MLDIILGFLQDFMDYAAEKEGIETPKPQQPSSDYEYYEMLYKNRADKMAEAKIQIEKETDPIRKIKMQERLSFGVTDFSDI